MKENKKIIIILGLLLMSFSIVFGSNFIFDKTAWHNTQDFSYESGTGQERVSSEFELDSVTCGGAGSVYDMTTGLCWEKNHSISTYNWSDAVTHCENENVAGGNWRLPEKAELMTLLYHAGYGATISKLNGLFSTSNIQNYYWSNTKYYSSNADLVRFNYGYSFFDDVSSSDRNYVVCVKTAS